MKPSFTADEAACSANLVSCAGHHAARNWDLVVPQPSSQTALIAAVREGNLEAAEGLLLEGVDPNVQDNLGRSALHYAVSGGHAVAAACLLSYGATHTVADNEGRTPLGLDYTDIQTLHAIRQQHRRFRKRGASGTRPLSPEAAACAAELGRSGIVKVSGLIDPESLARMQHDFRGFIRQLNSKVMLGEGQFKHYDEEQHWWPNDRAYVSNNAFKHSAELVKLCCRATLLAVIDSYIGQTAYVQRGVAMRYLSSETTHTNMFGWHHDLEEQRVKLMILLSDVSESDQYMSYVVGSHKLLHPYEMFFENKCSLDYCRQHLGENEVFKTTGSAGDVFIFDSNGAHRGNRRPDARSRDTFFVEYTSDKSDIWGGDIPREVFNEITLEGPNPFDWMMSVQKKWEIARVMRKAPTWIENLPRLETWL